MYDGREVEEYMWSSCRLSGQNNLANALITSKGYCDHAGDEVRNI
jgi:hypothetical protein